MTAPDWSRHEAVARALCEQDGGHWGADPEDDDTDRYLDLASAALLALEAPAPPEPTPAETERVPWVDALDRHHVDGFTIESIGHDVTDPGPYVSASDVEDGFRWAEDDGTVEVLVEAPTPPAPEPGPPQHEGHDGTDARPESCALCRWFDSDASDPPPAPSGPVVPQDPDLVAVELPRADVEALAEGRLTSAAGERLWNSCAAALEGPTEAEQGETGRGPAGSQGEAT